MPDLDMTYQALPGSARTVSPLPLTGAELSHAALTVGKPFLAHGVVARSRLELVWRVLVVRTAVTGQSGVWRRSASFDELDPSEKGAVQYLLGLAQARATTHAVLDIPDLLHLDTALRLWGIPRKGARPDLVGLAAGGGLVFVEAKGRRRLGHAAQIATVSAAKAQALDYYPATLALASVSWFSSDRWCGHLADPPTGDGTPPFSSDDVLLSATWPLVQAISESDHERVGDVVIADLPEADLRFSMPSAVVDAFENGALPRSPEARTEAAARIRAGRRSTDRPTTPSGPADSTWDRSRTTTGLDGVSVVLGDSWSGWAGCERHG